MREGNCVAINVQCSIDRIAHSGDENEALQTKAAKLIYKVIGQNADLTRFDQLRLMFRDQHQNKKQKPTSERDAYETLTVKLQNCVLSCKYTTKDAMEMDYIAKRGLQLDTTYNKLLKKLELIKKILSIWSQFCL